MSGIVDDQPMEDLLAEVEIEEVDESAMEMAGEMCDILNEDETPTRPLPVEDQAQLSVGLHRKPVHGLSSFGSFFCSGGEDDMAYLCEMGSQSSVAITHKDTVVSTSFSWDGQLVATGSYDGSIQIHRQDGTPLPPCEGPESDVEFLGWHPKGDVILSGHADGTVWIWRVFGNGDGPQVLHVLLGHGSRITSGLWVDDGKTCVTSDENGCLIHWSPKTGKALDKFHPLFEGEITCLAQGGLLMAAGCVSGEVALFQRFCLLKKLEVPHEDSVEAIQFGPAYLATGGLDSKILIYELGKLLIRHTLKDHSEGVTSLLWMGDYQLVSGSLDMSLKVWDARVGCLLRTLVGHRGPIYQVVALGTDRVLSASEDCSVKVWAI